LEKRKKSDQVNKALRDKWIGERVRVVLNVRATEVCPNVPKIWNTYIIRDVFMLNDVVHFYLIGVVNKKISFTEGYMEPAFKIRIFEVPEIGKIPIELSSFTHDYKIDGSHIRMN
jgi:hypothetical protein